MLLKICLIFLISFPVLTICPCVSADVYQLKRNYIHPWKLLWKIFETSMKDPWNFFEDPWSFNDRPLNPSWNSPWNWLKRLESPVKHSWNTLEISLWHPWNFPKTPRKHLKYFHTIQYLLWHTPFELASSTLKNTPETPSKFSLKTLEMLSTHTLHFHTKNFLQHPWNSLKHHGNFI